MDYIDHDFPGRGKKIGIIGVPLGFGAGHSGSEMGGNAIRGADIRGRRLVEHIKDLGYEVKDYGDVEISHPEYTASHNENPKYLEEMIISCRKMAVGIGGVLKDGAFPIILGGDHSIAAGTFSAISKFFGEQGKEIGLIWLDAHTDMNTPETSPSGNIHGMPLSAILGRGDERLTNLSGKTPALNKNFLAHVGARDVDAGEKKLIRELGLRDQFFTMSDIDKRGMTECVEDAVKIASQAKDGFVVTFDIDVIDPRFAPGSGTLVRGGITYREAHLALEIIAECGGMQALEIVEVNPTLDTANITVELAGELILSALGKTIL